MNGKQFFGCVAIVGLLFGGAALAGEDDVNVKGQYVWDRGDSEVPGEVEAVFTPTGKNAWDVVFHFEWEGEQRVWQGSATGSLEEGELEGQGIEERGRERTFLFKGKVINGVFTGEHGSMRDGNWNSLGSLTFRP